MESVYNELDEAKAEIEKLREQYRVKSELAESLKRAHSDQVSKNKEASCKLEKLAQELSEKDYEISTARQTYEELKSTLKEKESIIKHLTSAHDKLRMDCNEKLKKYEEENRALALALDDANLKNMDQEKHICTLTQQLEEVKQLLAFSQKKCSESENKTRNSKELGRREDAFFKLEEENKKFEDQLKWKKEQFVHLEEAYEKLRNKFRVKEKEWEKEKGELLDGISSLETNLESQTRISQDLKRKLEMCNQALTHAESKRKILEAQLLESRTNFETVCAEYEDTKLSFENLTAQRDQEVASLRSSLGTKEILYNEMEYQFKKLEQEKQELLISLKNLQEAEIRDSGFSSASKLQNKLKNLEQVHKGCSTNLKAKESQWRSQMEKLSEELSFCKLELKGRDKSLNELNKELEACDSLILKLELLNQETSLILLVLKSEFSDKHSCMNLKNKQMQEQVNKLVEELEKKKDALNSVQKDLEEERERVVILSKKVQTLEELKLPLQKELKRLKEMLEESKTCELKSNEEVLQIRSDLKKVCDALDRANGELNEKFCEVNEIEFELQIWKSVADKLEANLKRSHQMRRDVEASLIAQMEVEVNLKLEKEHLNHQLEEKEKTIDDLQQQLVEVNENERSKTESPLQKETETLHQLVEEKDQRIYDLQQLVASLEQEFETSTSLFSSRLSQMQKEMNIFHESWEKIKEAEVLKEIEIQEKNIMIIELEKDIGRLLQRVEDQERALLDSDKKLEDIQVELAKKQMEVHRISTLEKTMKNLSTENKNLVKTMSLLSERVEQLTEEDSRLMGSLEKIVKGISRDWPEWNGEDEQENMNILSSPLMKKVEVIHKERSPLRAIN
ncbi:hypothetical protein CDL12_26330 [Handroanthus impetiginosus]|uniref:Uncharacterized protein n=1 Tax=Handroanthus impetiginosus TaxID=429701 RepID=A0A2G9G7I2_9LAMI|nr:hypothetical protein CDL12_26330 [Handroanthus impetiginosus]